MNTAVTDITIPVLFSPYLFPVSMIIICIKIQRYSLSFNDYTAVFRYSSPCSAAGNALLFAGQTVATLPGKPSVRPDATLRQPLSIAPWPPVWPPDSRLADNSGSAHFVNFVWVHSFFLSPFTFPDTSGIQDKRYFLIIFYLFVSKVISDIQDNTPHLT